jgi:hypothetical protein
MRSELPPGNIAETDETEGFVRATATTTDPALPNVVPAEATTEMAWPLIPPAGTKSVRVTDPYDTSTTSSLATRHVVVTWMRDFGVIFGSGCADTGVGVPGGLEAAGGDVGGGVGRPTCPDAIVEG